VLTDRWTEFKASQYIPRSLRSLGGYKKLACDELTGDELTE